MGARPVRIHGIDEKRILNKENGNQNRGVKNVSKQRG